MTGETEAPKGVSPVRRAGRRLRRDRAAMLALGFLVLVGLAAALAPWIARFAPTDQDLGNTFATPSTEHWMGTDDLGRDIFSRILFGARVSMRATVLIVGAALAAAIPVGLVAGFSGGRIDNVIMRVVDAVMSFPPLILALAIAGVLGPSITNATIAIAVVMSPTFIRLIRAQALSVSQETFVEASRSLGTHNAVILGKRILPNVASPLIIQASIALGAALLAEASLSFLGLGAQPPDASWGSMLRRSYDFIFTASWQMLVPGGMIALSVLAFNTLGDGLRDALGADTRTGAEKRPRRLGITQILTGDRIGRVQPAAETRPEGLRPLLSVRDLQVGFETEGGPVTVVDGVSFDVKPGEVLGLVGESGSGKTVTALSIMRLIPSPPGRITDGSVVFEGTDLLQAEFEQLRRLRGNDIAMVFQDPMTGLNPAYTVGNQLVEAIQLHNRLSDDAARARALELLRRVGIPDPEDRLDEYPHRFSGGMRQRAMIAMALSCDPKLLIADEPTTALDVTVQAQILDLLRDLQRETGMAIIFVTHDLGVVADICDRVAVMYAGEIVEQGTASQLFADPRHPYTEGLLSAIPQTGGARERLHTIPGVVPPPAEMPEGCRFAPRCPYARAVCTEEPIALEQLDHRRQTRCVRHGELDLQGTAKATTT